MPIRDGVVRSIAIRFRGRIVWIHERPIRLGICWRGCGGQIGRCAFGSRWSRRQSWTHVVEVECEMSASTHTCGCHSMPNRSTHHQSMDTLLLDSTALRQLVPSFPSLLLGLGSQFVFKPLSFRCFFFVVDVCLLFETKGVDRLFVMEVSMMMTAMGGGVFEGMSLAGHQWCWLWFVRWKVVGAMLEVQNIYCARTW